MDRYSGVRDPFAWRIKSTRNAKVVVPLTWLLSVCAALPYFMFGGLRSTNGGWCACVWPNSPPKTWYTISTSTLNISFMMKEKEINSLLYCTFFNYPKNFRKNPGLLSYKLKSSFVLLVIFKTKNISDNFFLLRYMLVTMVVQYIFPFFLIASLSVHIIWIIARGRESINR